jgi:hypothetical protein
VLIPFLFPLSSSLNLFLASWLTAFTPLAVCLVPPACLNENDFPVVSAESQSQTDGLFSSGTVDSESQVSVRDGVHVTVCVPNEAHMGRLGAAFAEERAR